MRVRVCDAIRNERAPLQRYVTRIYAILLIAD